MQVLQAKLLEFSLLFLPHEYALRSKQVVADSNFKYVLEIKDVPKFKDART